MSLTVEVLPFSQDNYVFIINKNSSKDVAVVDPGESAVVIDYINNNNLNLKTILITHHHPDHIGGVLELKQLYNCEVIAFEGDKNRITSYTKTVSENERISVCDTEFEVLFVPGHTLGHIAYYSPKEKMLFCGDTLFSLGCGRLFEGTPEQMLNSLNKIKVLPADTKIYCAHEYTLSNAEFAITVDPHNKELLSYRDKVSQLRAENTPTIPTVLSQEIAANPFLRSDSIEIQKTLDLEGRNCSDVFAKIRTLKDNF